jgi:hypothetical protein
MHIGSAKVFQVFRVICTIPPHFGQHDTFFMMYHCQKSLMIESLAALAAQSHCPGTSQVESANWLLHRFYVSLEAFWSCTVVVYGHNFATFGHCTQTASGHLCYSACMGDH